MRRHRLHTAALGHDDADRFATAVLLGFPRDDPDTVELVNFGHEPPLAVGPHGLRALPGADGLPLGLGDLTDDRPRVRRVPLGREETLLLMTDGVTEARDRAGEFYEPVRELARAVAVDPQLAEPRRLVRRVRDGVLLHSGGHLVDDTTVFAMRRVGEGPVQGRLRS